ncbi:MAG: PDZ domain-containing protein [Nakamurella sp.]
MSAPTDSAERAGAVGRAGKRGPRWFSRMTVRGRTVVVGATASVVLLLAAALIPIPYVAVGPGVTYDTLGSVDGVEVITFSGDDIPASATQDTADGGHLNMTTISLFDGVSLFEALGMWATGRYALAPREDYFPPDKTVDEVKEQDAQAFRDSQSAAEIASLRYLGYPNVTYVGEIPNGSPSAGLLEPQDQIVDVNGTAVTDFPSLQAALAGTTPGQVVDVTVLRSGEQVTVKVTLGANADAGSQGFLGIGAVERPTAPFTTSIALEKIGGPSAGLMFTLGIIDKLTDDDLTGGQFIAGTGTIDPEGTVGPIGGVLLKLITARDAGATIFLTPADNCAEAVTQIPDGLQLVKVSTLSDAVTALETLKAGGTPPGC